MIERCGCPVEVAGRTDFLCAREFDHAGPCEPSLTEVWARAAMLAMEARGLRDWLVERAGAVA